MGLPQFVKEPPMSTVIDLEIEAAGLEIGNHRPSRPR